MIEIQNASVKYSGVEALSNVNLAVARGEFVFVVGPTGAGKSTLLKLLYRDARATDGSVVVSGHDLNRMPLRQIPQFRRKLGIVFQDFGLLPNKTVYENVAFALRVIGATRAEIRKQVQATLEMVGMTHRPDAFPHQISGGEQQRVAIARALINNPPLLIADEPTGNLDPDTSIGIVQLLAHINQNGTTILVATHDSHVVDQMQKRVIAFAGGRLVRDDAQGAYRPEDFEATDSTVSASVTETPAPAESFAVVDGTLALAGQPEPNGSTAIEVAAELSEAAQCH